VTAVDVDVESIEHLDFTQACEIRIVRQVVFLGIVVPVGIDDECQQPAVGIFQCKGCADAALTCEEHRQAVLARPHVWCSACGRHGAPGYVYAFEPLRVTS